MIRNRRRSTAVLYLAGDMVATLLAFLAAWTLRFELQIPALTKGAPPLSVYLLTLLPIVLIVWPVVFYFHGLYQSRRDRSRVDEALTILLATVVGTLVLSSIQAWYRPTFEASPNFAFSRAFVGWFLVLGVVFVVTSRLITREVLRRRRLRGLNLQRILIVGAGDMGKEINHKILAHRALGFEVVGFLDDDPNKTGRSFLGTPVIGTLKDVEAVITEQAVDQVYVALPLEAHRKMIQVMETVGKHCVEIKLAPDVLQYATLKATLEDLDGMPVINLSRTPLEGWHSMIKRGVDVVLAAAALVVLLPGLPIIAWLIKREDGGPVFYKQERMGLDGKPFMILKFRSMRIDAESSTGPVWATRHDDRRTGIGEFIRKWSIDELPQVWNVLRGDMSIVGPRPERPSFVHEFRHKIPDYMLRHRVRAGITGWAQVHGWRGNTSIRKRIQYDLYYIQNWSLKLDFKILWMTFRSGAWHNAY